MATKRVILANGSRLLREVFQHVISKANHLEIVCNLPHVEELPSAIERFAPEWVILSMPFHGRERDQVENWTEEYPSVHFILLFPNNSRVKMKWQLSSEADLTNLSLKDFLHILEKDPQHIQ